MIALRFTLAFAALVLPPAAAAAQTVQEDAIVVTAPLEGARLESLQGAEVLGRDEIQQNLTGGLGETLAATPGVTSTYFGAGASRPIIRGLGDDRVRVLENGIGAIDAASASPDHAVTADGLDAHRIEVLRGAAALAYGGNAIGGVVNVIDDSIPTRAQDAPAFDTLAAFSSADNGRQGALGATFGAGGFAARLSIAARESDDFAIPGFARSARLRADDPLGPGETEAEGTAPNADTSLRSYAAGASAVGGWGYAGLAVKRYETEYGLPPEDAASRIGGHIELEQTRIETRGDIRVGFGPISRLDWGAQHADYEHTEFEADGAPGTAFTSEGYEARLEAHNVAFDGKLTGAFGLQLSDVDFEAIGDESFIAATNTTDHGAFIAQRWEQGVFGFEGGLRYEQRDLENVIFGARDFDSVSGSAGAFITPAEHWFLGLTIARTERAPTAVELFAEGPHLATESFEQGDPGLDIEAAQSAEISARYTTDAFAFESNIYRVNFDGYIALLPSGLVWAGDSGVFDPAAPPTGAPAPDEDLLPVFAFIQRDAEFTGGEISFSARLAQIGAWTLRGEAAADLVRAFFDAGGALPRIPPRTQRLGLEADSGAWTLRVEGVDIAGQDQVAAFETGTGGSTVLNARATWRPFGNERAISVLFDGRNLTDEEVRVHASFLKDVLPRPGRSFRIALRADF